MSNPKLKTPSPNIPQGNVNRSERLTRSASDLLEVHMILADFNKSWASRVLGVLNCERLPTQGLNIFFNDKVYQVKHVIIGAFPAIEGSTNLDSEYYILVEEMGRISFYNDADLLSWMKKR